VQLWDVGSGTRIHTLLVSDEYTRIHTLAYSPRGDQVASPGPDNAVLLWDTETGECRNRLTGHAQGVTKVLFSPKGDHMASVSGERMVRLWTVGPGTTRVVCNSHSEEVSGVVYSSERRQIISFSKDMAKRAWDAQTGACLQKLPGHDALASSFIYLPQYDRILSWVDSTLSLWDVESITRFRTFEGHSGRIYGADFSPQRGQIASANKDGTVQLWNVETGECQHVLNGHHSTVKVVKYSLCGSQVASGSDDNTVRLWNTRTGACQQILIGHTRAIRSITYSSDGSQMASLCYDGTIRLWSIETGVSNIIRCNDSWGFTPITNVAFSPQGHRLASGDVLGRVRLWDVSKGECPSTILTGNSGFDAATGTITFSPRGNLIISSNEAGVATLWDAETGDCCWKYNYDCKRNLWEPKANGVTWITSDIDSFLTGGADGSVMMWDVIEERGKYQVRLRWRSTSGHLTVEDARIQDVVGLSDVDKQLLEQRGADDPTFPIRETGKLFNSSSEEHSGAKEILDMFEDLKLMLHQFSLEYSIK